MIYEISIIFLRYPDNVDYIQSIVSIVVSFRFKFVNTAVLISYAATVAR